MIKKIKYPEQFTTNSSQHWNNLLIFGKDDNEKSELEYNRAEDIEQTITNDLMNDAMQDEI